MKKWAIIILLQLPSVYALGLHELAEQGDYDGVLSLLKNDADFTAKNDRGDTPLMVALKHVQLEREILKTLCKNDEDKLFKMGIPFKNITEVSTPAEKYLEIVRLIIHSSVLKLKKLSDEELSLVVDKGFVSNLGYNDAFKHYSGISKYNAWSSEVKRRGFNLVYLADKKPYFECQKCQKNQLIPNVSGLGADWFVYPWPVECRHKAQAKQE